MTRIYLAGKIAKNDWRHDLVPMLRKTYSFNDIDEWAKEWTPTPMYRKDFHYVGPYFVSCDHGCAHGENNHGAGANDAGCIEPMFPYRPHYMQQAIQEDVMIRCRQAICDCDVFFAWLESPCTAYGTLVEIGLAAALGKTIVIGSDDIHEDLWFAYKQADAVISLPSPELSFKNWADTFHPVDDQRAKCESPLELAFWDSHLCHRLPALKGLVAQHKVSAGGNNYRLDFAIPERKVAFEMDGFTYHSDKEAFNRDRRRDLDLKVAGWQIHRFDGDLIRDDTPKAILLAAQLAENAH